MSFWNYSIEIYRTSQVSESCLKLQNNYGLDVNLVLFCCWHGINFGKFNQGFFNQCFDFSRAWSDNSVKPLRSVRIWLKNTGCVDHQIDEATCTEFRNSIKQIELESEKLQQLALEFFCQSLQNLELGDVEKTEAVAKNLKIYLDTLNISANRDIINSVEILAQESIKEIDKNLFRQIFTS